MTHWFGTKIYGKIYNYTIEPVNGFKLWAKSRYEPPEPPLLRRPLDKFKI